MQLFKIDIIAHKCVDMAHKNQGRNNECMHVKWKYVTIMWNDYAWIKFHFY
jgi:hypothetical protein